MHDLVYLIVVVTVVTYLIEYIRVVTYLVEYKIYLSILLNCDHQSMNESFFGGRTRYKSWALGSVS